MNPFDDEGYLISRTVEYRTASPPTTTRSTRMPALTALTIALLSQLLTSHSVTPKVLWNSIIPHISDIFYLYYSYCFNIKNTCS